MTALELVRGADLPAGAAAAAAAGREQDAWTSWQLRNSVQKY